MSLPPGALVEMEDVTDPAKRPAIAIPPLGKTAVQLSRREAESFRSQIDQPLPPVFIELSAADGSKTVWCLEEDLEWLLSQKPAN